MNGNRKASRSLMWLPIALFVLAAALISLSTVSGVRAALSEESQNYVGTFTVRNIGVALTENGEVREGTDALLQGLLQEGESLSLDTAYAETLAGVNTGEIDQYVRAEVHKYWVDPQGQKLTDLDPALIKLTYGSDWIMADDGSGRSGERVVMYYPRAVAAAGTTTPFVTAVEIDGAIASKATQDRTETADGAVITTTYDYDGVSFVVEAELDAVQTHSAVAAIKAAWGVDATVEGGVITAIR